MFGSGMLLRILSRGGARLFDRLGFLPPRWFLKQALEALSEDDLPLVIRSLRRADERRSSRWELIRQQAVFRCRVLKDSHELALQRIEKLKESGFFNGIERNDLRQIIDLHRLAIRTLSSYEQDLQSLARLKPSGMKSPSEKNPSTILRNSGVGFLHLLFSALIAALRV